MAAASTLRVDLVETLDGVAALRQEWEALEASVPEATGFQSFAWCHLWLSLSANITPNRVKPRVVTLRQDGRLVMLWPLETARFLGLRIARWIGEPMTQYGDALAEPGQGRAAWHAAATAEMARWRDIDLVSLARMRSDGVLAPHGEGDRPALGGTAPYIDLSVPSREVQRMASDRSLKRRERRGVPLHIEEISDPDQKIIAVRQALAFKTKWLRAKRLFSAGLSHPVAAPFLEGLAATGFLNVSMLRVDDANAAVELGFIAGRTYRSLLSAYDLAHADRSPGHALTSRLLGRMQDRGLGRFDLLAPTDAYKVKWSSGQTALLGSLQVLTWRGFVGAWYFSSLRPALKGLVRMATRLRRAGGGARIAPRPPRGARGPGRLNAAG